MAQLVAPDETLIRAPELWVPGRKPVGPVKIDWSHPLARGITHCFLFQDDSVRNIVTGEVLQKYGNTTWQPNGLYFDESGDYFITQARLSASYTFVFDLNMSDITGGAFQYIISQRTFGDTNSLNLYVNEESVVQVVTGGVRCALANSQFVDSTDAWFPTFNNKPFSIRTLVGVMSMFADGQSFAVSNSNAVAALSGALDNLYIMARTDLNTERYAEGLLKYFFIYESTALTDGQIASLHRNPYQFLIPA